MSFSIERSMLNTRCGGAAKERCAVVVAGDLLTTLESADLPRCSITISGPPTLSLSSDRYHLTATLQHHSNPESQPITFRLHGSPIWEIAAVQGTYLLYEAKKGGGSETKEDDNVAAPQCFPEYNFDDDPLPVTPEHFATLQVGESMTRQLGLSPSDFELKPDTQYRLLMPHAYLGWWEYGEMEVRIAAP